ncbi:hypothetical protein GCM10010363_01820 [Streptomyces omiyaensis]|nr:hypothetical protein GCM10010363_01820 [Streptomyces omiyaensis]
MPWVDPSIVPLRPSVQDASRTSDLTPSQITELTPSQEWGGAEEARRPRRGGGVSGRPGRYFRFGAVRAIRRAIRSASRDISLSIPLMGLANPTK